MHVLQPNIAQHHSKKLRVVLGHRIDAGNDKIGRMESAEERHEDGEHTHKLSSFAFGETEKNKVPDGGEVLLESLKGKELNDGFEEIKGLVIVLLGSNQPLEDTQDALQILENVWAPLELLEISLKKTNHSGNVGCALPQRRVEELREDGIVGRGNFSRQLQQQRHHLEDIGRILSDVLGKNVLKGGEKKFLEGSNLGRVPSSNVLHNSSDRLKEEVAKSGVLGVLGHLGQDSAQLLDDKLVEGGNVSLHLGQNPHNTLHGVFILITGVVVQPSLLLSLQHLKGVLKDGWNILLITVPNTEGLVGVTSGNVLFDGHSSVGVDDKVLRGKHLGKTIEEGRVKIKRNHLAESCGKLQSVGLQHGVPLRKRFQIREDVRVEIVKNGDKRVGGSRPVSRSLVSNCEGRDEISAHILFPPVLSRVGGVHVEALGDIGSQNVGHLGLKVLAKTLHEGKGGTSPSPRVRSLDISSDVLNWVLTEILLIRLGEKHVGDNNLLANSGHGGLVVEELVVYSRRGN